MSMREFFREYGDVVVDEDAVRAKVSTLLEGRRRVGKEWAGLNPVAVLAQVFVEKGREGLMKCDKWLGELDGDAVIILETFKEYAPEDLSAVVIGCAVRTLQEAVVDGSFSFKNFMARLGEGVTGTQLSMNFSANYPETEVISAKQRRRMFAAIRSDPSFAAFLNGPKSLLPESLFRYLRNELRVGTVKFGISFFEVLDFYQKLASCLPESSKS